MVFSCKRCGSCCRAYWITMLPFERTAMAKELALSEKRFTEKFCQLLLQLFPVPATHKKGLVVSAQKMPKKLLKKIEKKLKQKPQGFIALPSIAFKRNRETCVMFDKTKSACLVHKSKPEQCSLFPFISLSEKPDFSKLYGFCNGLKAKPSVPKDWQKAVSGHYARFAKYFEAIAKNGFKAIWQRWPERGTLLLKNAFVCRISEKEFFKIIENLCQ